MANAKPAPPDSLCEARFYAAMSDGALKLSTLTDRLAEAVAAGFGDFDITSAEFEYGMVRVAVERGDA